VFCPKGLRWDTEGEGLAARGEKPIPVNILLLMAHSIEEYDQVRLLSGLGHDVFSLGGYIDPARPHDPKRPALPEAPRHPDLKEVVDRLGTGDNLEAAKCQLPEPLLEWADAVICHHHERRWLGEQWPRLRRFIQGGGRVIWRTVGQSATPNELAMSALRPEGLEIVRYSPKERSIPGYAGEDALIRFYKDPEEWTGWTGEQEVVINITASFLQRAEATHHGFWEAATEGLPRMPLGRESEAIGGPGELPLEEIHAWLRRARVYLYTGTEPASYTLGFIEAMMTGIPVVCIGAGWFRSLPYGPGLFEACDLVRDRCEDPGEARECLAGLLADHQQARNVSAPQRRAAIRLFGKKAVAAQWKAYLG